MQQRVLRLAFVFALAAAPAVATVPGGIDITCDVPRSGTPSFRSAAKGQGTVEFKLWSAATGGVQLGSDYTVPMANLAVAKRYTDNYDSVRPRKAARINATIGSDGSPVLLPVDGQAWLEVTVGTTTLGCDFAATGDPAARRRLQSVAFSREASHSETCETCTSTADVSVRVTNSTPLIIPNGSETVLTFDQDVWDASHMHSSGSGCLNAATAGKYLIFAHVRWYESDATAGYRELKLRVNGTAVAEQFDLSPTSGTSAVYQSLATHYQVAAGQCVDAVVTQTSGASASIVANPDRTPVLGMVKLP